MVRLDGPDRSAGRGDQGGIESLTHQPRELRADLHEEATATESKLGFWIGCPIQDDQRLEQLSVKLCEPTSGKVSEDAHDLIRRILRSGQNDSTALCAVDSAVVRSLEQCPSLRKQQDVAITASILLDLADAWMRQGGDERAGQLYQHANFLLEGAPGSQLNRMKALEAWACLSYNAVSWSTQRSSLIDS